MKNRTRKSYVIVYSSHIFRPPPPAFRRLSLSLLSDLSYPWSPFISTVYSAFSAPFVRLCSSAPFRSLFRACTLCYPANINGAERTIQRRTMQSMNDGIVRGTCSGRDDFSYLRSSFSLLLSSYCVAIPTLAFP